MGGELIPATFRHLLEHIQRWRAQHSPSLPLPGGFSSSDTFLSLSSMPCSRCLQLDLFCMRFLFCYVQAAASPHGLLHTPHPRSLSQGGFQVSM